MSDISGIDSLREVFSSLQREARGDLMLKCLRKGGMALQEKTRQELRSTLGPGATSTVHHKKPMERGVTVKTDKAYSEVRVSIMGDFRLKWFELGTKDRALRRTGAKDRSRGRSSADKRYLYRKQGKEKMYKAGSSRGKIRPLGFFRNARADEAVVTAAIEAEFDSQMKKLLR